jgi:hypothetical protein
MGSDPRRGAGRQGQRGRSDRLPGWADSLLAGRSRADKEAEQDAQMRVMFVGGAVVGVVILALNALFTTVGLQFGWWSALVFAPLFLWLLVSAASNRVLRPVELDGLRWRQRLYGAGLLLVVLWVAWPLWAGPVARAWKAAHGGFGGVGSRVPRYPLGAVLGASPVAMGLLAFLLLALGMVLAPRIRAREPKHTPPPGGPEPLRAPLLAQRRPDPHPRWPPDDPRWP